LDAARHHRLGGGLPREPAAKLRVAIPSGAVFLPVQPHSFAICKTSVDPTRRASTFLMETTLNNYVGN